MGINKPFAMHWREDYPQNMDEREKTRRKGKITDSAYRILGGRDHAEKELRTKLLRKYEEDEEIVEEVIAEMHEQDYLNEERFARGWVRSMLRRRPVSRFLAGNKLQKTGVAAHIVENAIEEEYPAEREREIVKELAERKIAKSYGKEGRQLAAAVGRHLQSRGFPEGAVWGILHEEGLLGGPKSD